MALNIAVPLSGVGGLSPISPISLDCWEQIKMLVSPIGSESSGVSSLDSEEAKVSLHIICYVLLDVILTVIQFNL